LRGETRDGRLSKVVGLHKLGLHKELVRKTGITHEKLLEREDSVKRLVTSVAKRRVRCHGDLQVVQQLSQRRKRLSTIANARDTLALRLTE